MIRYVTSFYEYTVQQRQPIRTLPTSFNEHTVVEWQPARTLFSLVLRTYDCLEETNTIRYVDSFYGHIVAQQQPLRYAIQTRFTNILLRSNNQRDTLCATLASDMRTLQLRRYIFLPIWPCWLITPLISRTTFDPTCSLVGWDVCWPAPSTARASPSTARGKEERRRLLTQPEVTG